MYKEIMDTKATKDKKDTIDTKDKKDKKDTKDNKETKDTKNYTKDTRLQKLLSRQLNLEFTSFYIYNYMSTLSIHHSLNGHSKFFKTQQSEEIKHATGIAEFAIKHGITLDYNPICLPSDVSSLIKIKTEDFNVCDMFKCALKHEMCEYDNVLEICKYVNDVNDFRVSIFIDSYVEEQCKSIRELEELIVNSKRCGSGEGLYIFDQCLMNMKR